MLRTANPWAEARWHEAWRASCMSGTRGNCLPVAFPIDEQVLIVSSSSSSSPHSFIVIALISYSYTRSRTLLKKTLFLTHPRLASDLLHDRSVQAHAFLSGLPSSEADVHLSARKPPTKPGSGLRKFSEYLNPCTTGILPRGGVLCRWRSSLWRNKSSRICCSRPWTSLASCCSSRCAGPRTNPSLGRCHSLSTGDEFLVLGFLQAEGCLRKQQF